MLAYGAPSVEPYRTEGFGYRTQNATTSMRRIDVMRRKVGRGKGAGPSLDEVSGMSVNMWSHMYHHLGRPSIPFSV